MTEEDRAKLLHEAETRALDFLARFPALVVLAGVWRVAKHLETELRDRGDGTAALLGRLCAFVEGRDALANLREGEDRAPLRDFKKELDRVLPDGLAEQETALRLLCDWLAVAGDPRIQEARLAEVAERDEAWLRGLDDDGPARGVLPHAP